MNPDAGFAGISSGAGCSRAGWGGAGHPPPKAGRPPARRLTWSALEKMGVVSAFAGGGAGEVVHG